VTYTYDEKSRLATIKDGVGTTTLTYDAASRLATIDGPWEYVLRTGVIWNALPREQFEGVSSAMVHRKYQQWARAGVFRRIWQRGLAE
jgi:YD repeat-containing protein